MTVTEAAAATAAAAPPPDPDMLRRRLDVLAPLIAAARGDE